MEKNTKNYSKNKKLIDLHTHSFYSDGDLSPNELIKLAKKNKISTIAITDHDTLLGNQNIEYDASIAGVRIINGIELSAKIKKGRMHILGYAIDINNSHLNEKMEELKENSINSVLAILKQIKKDYGLSFSEYQVNKLINAKHNIGRPDIAKLCIQNSYADSVKDAFNRYLVEAYSKTRKLTKGITYNECIDLIIKSGGIPVLAHPNTLERNNLELEELIKEMKEKGLKGIEVYHSNHSEEETKQYLYYADKFDLLISGGSDFHGESVKPDIQIGTGRKNNLAIKHLTILDEIKTYN